MIKTILFTAVIAFNCCVAQQQKRQLVWEENFTAKNLNEQVWNFELGNGCPNICGWGNNERQLYTKDNHQLKDGYLVITAKKDGEKYTSTRITTKGKKEFQYGRIEARAKLPIGKGIWPAFWMLGTNIDQVGCQKVARSTFWNTSEKSRTPYTRRCTCRISTATMPVRKRPIFQKSKKVFTFMP